jgi:pimeloyl-ACP methyl ester carboxylesterase
MAKERMRDIIVLIPGIMGSVLQKDGKDVWTTGRVAGTALTGLGSSSLQQLKLEGDEPDVEDLGDGINATHLITVPHLIAGLTKTDDYSALSSLITDHFEVIKANLDDNCPANFFEFPYDWRRDNRFAAYRLKQLIDRRLPQWREYSGAKDAKVIILAHSMGGLIARYYLEVLQGWQDCRTLVTFGTPHRGAVDAVNFVANGYKKIFLELTEVVRSFTSVYQLMPIYEMVNISGKYQRVAETDGIPNVVRERAEQALAFHREIEAAVDQHLNDVQYLRSGYRIIPVVGFRQDTLQSAELSQGKLTASYELPTEIASSLGEGDGTVPRFSAIPIELDQEYRETYIAQRHSCLQSSPQTLSDLCERLKQMQIRHKPVRGSEPSEEVAQRAAISLNLDDLYLTNEPVILRAKILNLSADPGVLKASITPVSGDGQPLDLEFEQQDHQWVLPIETLPQGLYRLEVRTRKSGPLAPMPVQDLFAVVNECAVN